MSGSLKNLGLVFLILASGGCSHDRLTGNYAPLSVEVCTNTLRHWPWKEDEETPLEASERVGRLRDSAAVIFESEDWETVWMTKPIHSQRVLISEVGRLLLNVTTGDKTMAAVDVPALSFVRADRPSSDELAILMDARLRKSGFNRVLFITQWGCLFELYPNGLPTKEEALRRKAEVVNWTNKQSQDKERK
jgi:hypothetical protein